MRTRSIAAAASVGLALTPAALAAEAPAGPDVAAALAARSEAGNAALMRGDIDRYVELVPLGREFLLMSPFGGHSGPARTYTPEELKAIGRFFRNGTFAQELIASYATDDLVVLAVVERTHVEVGGLPAQDWALRVTLVYRREGGEWWLVHRHADPLAHPVTLHDAAALARGAPPATR